MYRKVFLLTFCIAFQTSISLAEPLHDGGSSLVLLAEQPVLFVTHGTAGYDFSLSAKSGIDTAIGVFKSQYWPVIYLNDCSGDPKYKPYAADAKSTADICSHGGEHQVKIPTRHIFLTGGYFSECGLETAHDAVNSAFLWQETHNPGRRPVLVLNYVLDAIFTVTYKSILEEMGSRGIDPAVAFTYGNYVEDVLKNHVPTGPVASCGYDPAIGPTYRVELYYEDQFIRVLNEGSGTSPKLLFVRFTTSQSLTQNPTAYSNFLDRVVRKDSLNRVGKTGDTVILESPGLIFDGVTRPVQPHPVPVLP